MKKTIKLIFITFISLLILYFIFEVCSSSYKIERLKYGVLSGTPFLRHIQYIKYKMDRSEHYIDKNINNKIGMDYICFQLN